MMIARAKGNNTVEMIPEFMAVSFGGDLIMENQDSKIVNLNIYRL